jgi:hypothetical protein
MARNHRVQALLFIATLFFSLVCAPASGSVQRMRLPVGKYYIGGGGAVGVGGGADASGIYGPGGTVSASPKISGSAPGSSEGTLLPARCIDVGRRLSGDETSRRPAFDDDRRERSFFSICDLARDAPAMAVARRAWSVAENAMSAVVRVSCPRRNDPNVAGALAPINACWKLASE